PVRRSGVEANGSFTDLRGVVPVADVGEHAAFYANVRRSTIGANRAECATRDHNIFDGPIGSGRVEIYIFIAAHGGSGGATIQDGLALVLRLDRDPGGGGPGG